MTDTAKTRRPPGPEPMDIPPALAGMLEASHRTGQPVRVPVASLTDPDTKELLRYSRIHARRWNLSLRTRTAPRPGGLWLLISMTDKRTYARKAAPHGQDQA